MFQIVATVFGIGLLVFIHELGHFLMAKKFEIRVEKFTFGFGPEIVGFTYGETRYAICWIPLGGMVKMPGEDIDNASGSPDEFMSQPWYRRLIIAFFGPFMNYVLAVILFTIVIFHWGLGKPSPQPVIGEVMRVIRQRQRASSPATGSCSINGAPVKSWEDMADADPQTAGRRRSSSWSTGRRQTYLVTITPEKDPATGIGLIGIAPQIETEKVGLIACGGLERQDGRLPVGLHPEVSGRED